MTQFSAAEIANRLPFLGPPKRWLTATLDAVAPKRPSYSQHGEDQWLLRELEKWELTGGVYVDVGSNHPTRISNTYLLYRLGHSGVVIEPNRELIDLHQRVRPKDTAVCVGCGERAALGRFQFASTPVLSTFSSATQDVGYAPKILRTEYLPILPLDTILEDLGVDWTFFLSVDTEGFDVQVIAGATRALTRTLLVCVEANDAAAKSELCGRLGDQFALIGELGCNLLFLNQNPPTRRREAAR